MLRKMSGVSRGYMRPNRRVVARSACPVCGRPADDYHDSQRCHAEWNRRCDEEARQRSRGGNHAQS